MPVLTTGRQAIRAAGAATAAVPYVREAATDPDLRDAARTTLRSLSRIYDEMAADERLRDRLFDRARAASQEASRARRIRLSSRIVRWGILATGFAAGAVTIIAILAYPRSRKRVSQAVVDARNGVVSVTGRVRKRAPGAMEEVQETISSDGREVREAA